ncbi:putative metal-binding motif-containing protein [Myxococcus stipitatus]|uniref:putative metal-binding motif-containing protein n=1 Tax=Myxococcus stipitatus TaxID=83455 RepID=UPI00314503A7
MGTWLLLGCSVPSLDDVRAESRGFSIEVHYTPSFKTGCIEFQAQDEANAANVSAPMFLAGEALRYREPPMRLGLLRGWDDLPHDVRISERGMERWGSKIRVMVTAFEHDCEGKAVDRAELVVDVSGGRRKPSQSMVLMTPDADGDGYVARGEGNKGGTDCDDTGPNAAKRSPGNLEVCDEVDNDCDEAVDEGFDKVWYADKDDDGAVHEGDTKVQCTMPEKYIRLPQGKPFDCDDADKDNTPGKPEVCDDRDNNCVAGADEGFADKGKACNNDVCLGVNVCNLETMTLMCSAQPPQLYFPDMDRDGDGDWGAAATKLCPGEKSPAGYVENRHTDCDEADPTTFGGAAELCDAIDNNCANGIADESALCGGTLKQLTDYYVTSNSRDWNTVSTKEGGYPVWIAGNGGKLAVKREANKRFESYSFGDFSSPVPGDGSLPVNPNNCGNHDWTASWVDSQGRVFLGARNGRIALHNGASDHTCDAATTPTTAAITGIVGFETDGLTRYLYLTDISGRLLKWTLGGSPPVEILNTAGGSVELHGLHALREELLLSVGGATNSNQNRVRSYNGVTGGGTATTHTATSDDPYALAKAVWIGEENKACAVGDSGLVWRWAGGTTWDRVPVPAPNATSDFTSVVMRYDRANPQRPGNEQCYMVDARMTGRLRRLTKFGWAKEPVMPSTAEVALKDLALTSTPTGIEFWIVGENGRVIHYPEP